jgi:AAA family ATP:ADP antiporter
VAINMRSQASSETGMAAGVAQLLRLVTTVRPDETAKASLLTLNSFLLIFGYYQLKAAREGLLLAAHPASVKAYLAIPQLLLLIPVIKAFSHLSSRLPRHLLITHVTLFCIACLVAFSTLEWIGVPVAITGIVFFIWIGIFNLTIPAQFWGFANDIYTESEGKRLFPLIALGASLGGVAGPVVARQVIPVVGLYGIMLVTATILALTIVLTWAIHGRDLREGNGDESASVERQNPLDPGDGFKLVLRSRYLLLIAATVLLYNFVNALGEFMFSGLQRQTALRELGPQASAHELQNYIGAAFAGYQLLGNVIGLGVQLFLVSRVFRWVGISGALLVLPVIALGGYGIAAFGASLLLLKWVKAVENGVDYSLMKTARSALFLVTRRQEKYKAQAAIETFFVRGGDALCAAIVWLGTAVIPLSTEGFAAVNVAAVGVWILLSVAIARECARLKRAGAARAAIATSDPSRAS